MLTFREIGDFGRGQIKIEWVEDSRRKIPGVEALIDDAWARKKTELGDKLFDGPACRMERWLVQDGRLHLTLSRTSYKPFLGTNLSNPHLADLYGREILANTVGISPALISADGFLMLGRRNSSVAYYPNRIHPFAGGLEPSNSLDVFDEVMRELHEELAFAPRDVSEIRCLGVAEDAALRQPELIFVARSTRSRAQIEATMLKEEHDSSWACPVDRDSVDLALKSERQFTPVAIAVILLWGRLEFGDGWFEAQRQKF